MDGVLTIHITVVLCIRMLRIISTKIVIIAIQETKEGLLITVITEDPMETQGMQLLVHEAREVLLLAMQ